MQYIMTAAYIIAYCSTKHLVCSRDSLL